MKKKQQGYGCYRDEEEAAKTEAEQQRLSKMSIDELRVELETQLKARLIDEIQLIPQVVSDKVAELSEQLLLSLLGLRKDSFSSKFEIDSNNKNAALASQIGERVIAELHLATPDFFEKLAPVSPLYKKVKSAYQRAYTDAYAELLYEKVREAASEGASKHLAGVLDELQKSFDITISSQEKKEDE